MKVRDIVNMYLSLANMYKDATTDWSVVDSEIKKLLDMEVEIRKEKK